MEKITGIMDGVKSGWTKIDTKRRVTMVTLFIGVILAATIFTSFTQKANYATLFRNLEIQDAGSIVNDLDLKKIKYKLENGGKDILIDEKIIDKYRLQLAMDGMMPENSTGFEIFDNVGLMATDEDRKIMYQRALTGELQRSIMSLEVVNSAKVHLMLPQKSIFDSNEKEASASVIVDLKPYQKVTNDMIWGIAALVSGAVDNLPEKNIQIIDSKGNVLSSILQQNDSFTSLDVMNRYGTIRDEFEQKIESNLYDLLGSAYGKDKIKVSVYADLDFDSEESTTITYDNPVIRSDHINISGDSVNVSKVAGGSIDDNISNVTQGSVGDNSTYERITNNELSTQTKNSIKAPGKVNKLTTSVIYDGNLSSEALTKMQSIVASATGYDSDRGDLISIEGVVFDKSYEKQLQAELDAIKLDEENSSGITGLSKYIPTALRILGVIILISLIGAVISNRKQKNVKKDIAYNAPSAKDIDIGQIFNNHIEDLEVKTDENQSKAIKYAKENPETTAELIKTWIKE